jgi:hypothetical protein
MGRKIVSLLEKRGREVEFEFEDASLSLTYVILGTSAFIVAWHTHTSCYL